MCSFQFHCNSTRFPAAGNYTVHHFTLLSTVAAPVHHFRSAFLSSYISLARLERENLALTMRNSPLQTGDIINSCLICSRQWCDLLSNPMSHVVALKSQGIAYCTKVCILSVRFYRFNPIKSELLLFHGFQCDVK